MWLELEDAVEDDEEGRAEVREGETCRKVVPEKYCLRDGVAYVGGWEDEHATGMAEVLGGREAEGAGGWSGGGDDGRREKRVVGRGGRNKWRERGHGWS